MTLEIRRVDVVRRDLLCFEPPSRVRDDGKCDVIFEDGRVERRVVRLWFDAPGVFSVDGISGGWPVSLLRKV